MATSRSAKNDTLINTGTIRGHILLGASDSIYDSRGEVTGTFKASTKDLFVYNGSFGENMIDAFHAGGSSTHDTMEFAANDFGTFSAVMGAAHQVGADTVIRLDAADSITLVGVAKSSLVAADFKFV